MIDSAPSDHHRGHRSRARRAGVTGLAVLSAVGLLAPACGTKSPDVTATPEAVSPYANEIVSDANPTKGGRLIYGVPAESSSFNPVLASWAAYSLVIARSIYDNLAEYDEAGNPQPYLAESITSNADYTRWSVKLRPGVVFSNGKKVNAQIVVDMQRAIKSSPIVGVVFSRIADWEIKDDLSFDVVMNTPWSGYFNAMASQVGTVADPDWLTSPDVQHPIGTGPFIVDRWDVNKEMVLRKNPNYWRKDDKGNQFPYLDGITYKVITEESARIEALRKGDIDIMMQTYATPTVAALIGEAKAGAYQAFDDKQFEGPEDYILTNTSKAPLNDVDARRALAFALNLDDYVATITGGLDTPADSPWKPNSQWYSPVNYPKYDPVEATRLVNLVKARNGGKFSVTLLGNPSNESNRVTQYLQEQWAKVGIDVKLDSILQQTKIIKMLTGDYDLAFTQQFDNPQASAENVYWLNWPLAPGAPNLNFSRVNDPEVDRLTAEAWSVKGEKEKAAYAAIAKRFGEIVPFVWLAHASRTIVATNSVMNVVRSTLPDGDPMLQFIQGSHSVHQIWLKR
jgi:peptide/nickel transport system substrate-binding protein